MIDRNFQEVVFTIPIMLFTVYPGANVQKLSCCIRQSLREPPLLCFRTQSEVVTLEGQVILDYLHYVVASQVTENL